MSSSEKPEYPNKHSEQHAFCGYLTNSCGGASHYWDEETEKIKHGSGQQSKNKDMGMIIYCNYLTSHYGKLYHWNKDKQIVEYFDIVPSNGNDASNKSDSYDRSNKNNGFFYRLFGRFFS